MVTIVLKMGEIDLIGPWFGDGHAAFHVRGDAA
jgi:hypothetical protein